jgi:AraC-like DNA-binding protein
MSYQEWATALPSVVLWQRTARPAASSTLILPDGCLDLIWDGEQLFVAGPDTAARRHESARGAAYVGLRCSRGVGSALLGVAADEVRDQSLDLGKLWSAADVRRLSERVAADPARALATWLADIVPTAEPAPFGARVWALAEAGASVAVMAHRLGMSSRQLHRRCLTVFGYGPRHLARILRLGRALDQARSQVGLAQVAAEAGYCDQAHLSREVQALVGVTLTGLFSAGD